VGSQKAIYSLSESANRMKYNSKYIVFVNTSDGFEDCWSLFFLLFNKDWPESNAQILLNTERKY
jgi:hypothetical protein